MQASRPLKRGTHTAISCFHAVVSSDDTAEVVIAGQGPPPPALSAMLAEYGNHFVARDPLRPRRHHESSQNVVHLGGLARAGDPDALEFLRFMQRCGVIDHAVVFIRSSGRIVASFGVSRLAGQSVLGTSDLRFLNDVQPLLESSYVAMQRDGGATSSSVLLGRAGLSPRECEVAVLLARGMTNKEVAVALSRSPATVGSHARRIFAKLGVRNRTELASLLRT